MTQSQLLWVNLVKGIQYLLVVIKHCDFTQDLGCVVYSHSKKQVDLPAIQSHLYGSVFKDYLIILFQYSNEFVIDLGIHVDQLAVVHMPEILLLFPIHYLIGNIDIICIQFEPSH